MNARIVIALAVAGMTGLSSVTGLAQERERGHESARGPAAAPVQGPGEAHPGGRQGPPPGAAGGRMGGGPTPRGPGPAVGIAPGQAAQNPAFGQRPMPQAPAPAHAPAPAPAPKPAMRQPGGPAHTPEYGHHPMGQSPALRQPNHGPAATQEFRHQPGPDRRAPLARAPRPYGHVPAPYRGDIHRFVDLDARVWRGGNWHHSHHHGRYGWWWVVGGLWYFYPQPVYPYPDPFAPGDVIYEYGGSGDYWYYCESAGQYYPYVTQCPEGWQAVIPEQ